MKDEFYIVLPSNSSMEYYPDNTTTRYTTHLPQSVSLHGRWAVALVELHIPMTILHVPPEGEQNFINFVTNAIQPSVSGSGTDFQKDRACVPAGVYHSIYSLVESINEISCVAGHLRFSCTRNGHVTVKRICAACEDLEHSFYFSHLLNKILGFDHSGSITLQPKSTYTGERPASLVNGIPSMLFVYSDICEPYITGDVQTPLLRVVSSQVSDNYNYGSMKIKTFSPPRFVPLLRTNFQTITIDIRDEFGEPIPFERGTLTVTLQFKSIN